MRMNCKTIKTITALYYSLTGIYPLFFLWLEGRKTIQFLSFIIVEIAALLLYSVKKRRVLLFIAVALLSYALLYFTFTVIWAHTATPKYIAPLWIAEYTLAMLLIVITIRSSKSDSMITP